MADKFTNSQPQQGSSVDLSDEDTILAHAFGLSPDIAIGEYQAWHPSPADAGGNDSTLDWLGRIAGAQGIPFDRAKAAGNMGGGVTGKRRIIDAYKDLSKMGPDALVALQHQLYDAGMYDDSYYKKGGPRPQFGSLDDGTISAYGDVVMRSFRSGGRLTPGDVLNEGLGSNRGQEKTKGAAKPPPLTIQLTSPDDVVAVADATARKVLGRKLTDQELRQYVDAFHSMEAQSQQSKYAAEYSGGVDDQGNPIGTGGTITAPPDLSSFALSRARQENPTDTRNTELAHGFEVFHDLLRGA